MRSTIARFLFASSLTAFVAGMSGGCGGGGMGEGVSLLSRNPAQKIPAIKGAVKERDLATSAAPLVKALESKDPAERFYAIEGLKRLTGETHGYVYYEHEASRKTATLRWKQWLNERQDVEKE